ncbi:MAG TPA: hypothetical protein VG733_14910 [Chthoniobacteraceae bacterium]|nr:hypothetical protein [Chthoniobacteraceae bacterium]
MSEAPQSHITAEYYDRVRQQIEHEDNLITQRISWLMASQSFLFSAYAIILNGLQPRDNTPLSSVRFDFFHFLPFAGMISTALIYTSICGGVISIGRLRKRWDEQDVDALKLNRPPIHSRSLPFLLGQSAPRLLPLALIGMWLYLLFRGSGLESGLGH